MGKIKIFENLTSGNGIIGKVEDIVSKSVTDKDKRNQLMFELSTLLMKSRIAPYIRGFLAIITVVSIFFFSNKMTIDADTQKYVLTAVFAFYFLDWLRGKK